MKLSTVICLLAIGLLFATGCTAPRSNQSGSPTTVGGYLSVGATQKL